MPETRAQANRRIRQEALRQQLEQQGHVQHVVEMLVELREPKQELSALDLQRYRLVIDTKLALIKKYLPDAKDSLDVNVGGQEDNPVLTRVVREIVGTSNKDG